MAVDICRGADVAVTEPLLNLLHRHVVGQQERGTAMPEIMEPDMPQTVFFKQFIEITAQASGIEKISHSVYKDIAFVLLVVAVSADPLVFLLLLLLCQKLFPDARYQGERAQAGRGFRPVCADDLM